MKKASLLAIGALAVVVACGNPSPPPDYVSLSDTWTFDSHDWHQSSSGNGPTARSGEVFVYDAAADQVVMFGGTDVSETWTWNGHWTLRHPTHSPSARDWAAAAYDPIRRNIVLFGGSSTGGPLADTWTWDGDDWHQVSTSDAGPAGAFYRRETAAFDPVSGQVIFLSPCISVSCSADTRGWDGKNWIRYPAGAGAAPWPSPGETNSGDGPIIYTDAKHGRVVMLGGDSLLEWLGSKWSAVSGTGRLPGTAGGGLAYDNQIGSAISFGAYHCLSFSAGALSSDDTWEWDGSAWQQLEPLTRPPARSQTYVAYDSMMQSIVMFGGDRVNGCGIANLP
jgi:hypothetical protein